MSFATSITKLASTSSVRWAVSGWAFFIAENAILSENRTFLIHQFGDDRYHVLYGTCSTAAMGSIGYAYVLIRRQQVATAAKQGLGYFAMATSWVNMTLGLIMASQALPKLQVPVSSNLQVRCPFDFSDGKNGQAQGEIKGLERITRHPGLWSLAFVGLGNANLHHGPMRIWWTGPAFIALLGGSHTDSRFRRGMGGNLDPVYDSRTSNVPFAAILMGKQGSVHNSFVELLQDLKPLNAALAGLTATFWVASKGRIRV